MMLRVLLGWKIKRLRENFKRIVEMIKNSEEITVYYHFDGDGIFSMALFSKLLDKFGKKYEVKPFTYEDAIKSEEGLVIFLDCHPRKRIGDKMIVIDHHEIEKSKADIYLNFRKYFGKARSNAFYLSIVLKDYLKIPEEVFVASAYQDGALGESLDLLGEILGKDLERLYYRNFLNPYLRILGDLPAIILFDSESKEKVLEILREFIEVGVEVLERKNEEIKEIVKRINEMFLEALKNIKKVEAKKNFVVAWIRDHLKLYRMIIPYITLKYKSEVYVFIKEKGDYAKLSLRAIRRDLHKIMRCVERELDITWGGHKRAVGAQIKRRDVKRFLDIFERCLE